MPPVIYIEEEFVEKAKKFIQTSIIDDNEITTELDEINDDYERITIERIRVQIERTKEETRRRMELNDTIIGNTPFYVQGATTYHIIEAQLKKIFRNAIAMCDGCAQLMPSVNFSADVTESGTATMILTQGATDADVTDTSHNGNTNYFCPSCDEEIIEDTLTYYIPEEGKEMIVAYLNEVLDYQGIDTHGKPVEEPNNNDRNNNRPFGDTILNRIIQERTERPRTNEFPDGKQIQHDIGTHGPAGPSMHRNEKGTNKSFPENFIFRDNGKYWSCNHCEAQNNPQSRKCANNQCKKDKFEKITKIDIT